VSFSCTDGSRICQGGADHGEHGVWAYNGDLEALGSMTSAFRDRGTPGGQGQSSLKLKAFCPFCTQEGLKFKALHDSSPPCPWQTASHSHDQSLLSVSGEVWSAHAWICFCCHAAIMVVMRLMSVCVMALCRIVLVADWHRWSWHLPRIMNRLILWWTSCPLSNLLLL